MLAPEEKKGLEFKPYSGKIERGKIREMVQAIGDPNPVYTDSEFARQEGLKDITIPPTFMESFDMWEGASFDDLVEFLEMDARKVLHLEQEYEYFAPIYPEDEISAQTVVADVKTKRNGMALYTLETTYHNQDSQLVMKCRMVLVQVP